MARLPQPGSDDGIWGSVLNDFLSQSINTDGTLKAGSVATSQLQNGAVSETKLDTDVQAKLNAAGGGAVTNLSTSTTATTVTVASSTGDDATISAATAGLAGVMPAADKTKLDGIATGAQVNTVSSVAGKTGAVTLAKTDVGLANVDNTTDADKPISSATQSALTAKANDNAVVHLSGTETVAGVKTFSTSPVVPTPTTATQATNKSYVDSVAASGAADATTSTKGIVQLAGDLGGTAAAPTVPALTAKANDNAVVHLSGTETVAGVKTFSASPVIPTPTTSTQAANKSYVDSVAASGVTDNVPVTLHYSGSAWPTRASVTSSPTRMVMYISAITAPAPSDFVNNVDMWVRRG